MNRWGCFGLTLGGLVGLLAAILFFVWARQVASPLPVQPAALADPDVTLFLSEHSLSRFASDTLESPTALGQAGISENSYELVAPKDH
jgi:hypothetical protein